MTGTHSGSQRLLADDRLLDAVGRFEPPPDHDEVMTWLATWRNDLAEVQPAYLDLDAVRPAAAAPARRRMRSRRLLAGAAAALVVAGGGGAAVAAAAADAAPGSALWPVTKLVHPDRADSRLAQLEVEEIIEEARRAVAYQRYEEAERLLGEADPLASQVLEPAERLRLLDELAELHRLIPAEPPTIEGQPDKEPTVDLPGYDLDPESAIPPLPSDREPTAEPTAEPTPAPESPAPTEPTTAPTEPTLPLSPRPTLIP